MSEKAQIAEVVLVFMEVTSENGEPVGVQGTSVTWLAEDLGIAHTLKEQLTGLLGKPVGEAIWPVMAADAVKNMESPWPGLVHFREDESEH